MFQRLPFDWRTPSGYFAAFLVENVILFTIMLWLTCILFLVVGTVSFVTLLVHDVKSKLANLKSFATETHSEAELNTEIFSMIRRHCQAKQLSILNECFYGKLTAILLFFHHLRLAERFSNFYRIIAISYFVWSTTNICCALLQAHIVRSAKFGEKSILKRFFFKYFLVVKHSHRR